MATLPGQEVEPPRYNHPCGDLLDSERRRDYIDICVPLYRALIKGDLEVARVILEGREYLVRYSITEQKETPLHVAAAVRDPEFLSYLVDMMSEDDLKLQNEEGNNAFCVAAIAGNRYMAMIMLQKNGQLLTIRGSENMMPLYLAVFHKKRDMITYLYNSQSMACDGWTDDDRNTVFIECIKIDCFDVALEILNDREELPQDDYVWNVLHVLAQKAHVFRPKSHPKTFIIEGFKFYWKQLTYENNDRSGITLKKSEEDINMEKLQIDEKSEAEKNSLLRRIWKKIVEKNKDEIDVILRGPVVKIGEKDTYPSQILFVAAENGNIEFLVELIREYPDLIWKTNDNGQTIFHIGVIHGYESLFDLVYELGAMKDKITRLKDNDGNTLLHLVSVNTGRNSHRGAAFQLYSQLVRFQEVQALVPPSYNLLKNKAGQTPTELFTQNHKHLLPEGEKWIKETSNQCMVVAALITTISFSAAFTIPGGYNQTRGFPIFLTNKAFLAFVILDAISFILSSASILCFLSLSFSRYSEDDFVDSLTPALSFGLTILTLSIYTLMGAFIASFFVLYHNKLLPVPIIMTVLAVYIPFLFLVNQIPKWLDNKYFTQNAKE